MLQPVALVSAGSISSPEAKLSIASKRNASSTKLGGCGAQFAATRRHAAYWSMSCATLDEVVAGTRFSTVATFLEAVPQLAAKLETARQGLVQQGLSWCLSPRALVIAFSTVVNSTCTCHRFSGNQGQFSREANKERLCIFYYATGAIPASADSICNF